MMLRKTTLLLALLFLLMLLPQDSFAQSCVGNCGGSAGTCYCDSSCLAFGDCCSDYLTVCNEGGFDFIEPGDVKIVSIAQGEEIKFRFPILSGRKYKVVLLVLPTGGDLDLYTSTQSNLSRSIYDCRPFLGGTDDEVCSFQATVYGEGYALIHGFRAGSFVFSVFEQGSGVVTPDIENFESPVGPPAWNGWYLAQDFNVPNPSFGNKNHLGEDWNKNGGAYADLEMPVYAMEAGEVVYVQKPSSSWNGIVILRHRAPTGQVFDLPSEFMSPTSCNGVCGRNAGSCWCDTSCVSLGDCCQDYSDVCVQGAVSEVYTMYGHLSPNHVSDWLSVGDVVHQGQPIGVIGPTPSGSTGPHLHLEVRTESTAPGPGYSFDLLDRVDPSEFVQRN